MNRVVSLHVTGSPDPMAELDQVLEASDAVAYAGEAVARAAAASIALVSDLQESRLALRDLGLVVVKVVDHDPGREARRTGRGVCRVCGCDELHACALGCRWADSARTLCTSCAIVPTAPPGWTAQLVAHDGGAP